MSYNHPTVREILANSKSDNTLLRENFGKSYKNLACYDFIWVMKRKPTLDDAQQIYDFYEKAWENVLTEEYFEKRRKSVEAWAKTKEFRQLFR